MGYNPSKNTWVNPNIEYIFNSEIVEYDMKDAGFSLIRQYQLLTPEQIKKLEGLSKEERHVAIGKLQIGNKELTKSLSAKFAEMRELFIVANSLTDNNIITVKKDAIFVIGTCSKLKFGKVVFVPKKRYTSYIRFTTNMNIEVYYSDGEMDVKGISDSCLRRHRLYMTMFLQKMFGYLEGKNPSAKRYIRGFIDNYKSGALDDEYYIEFNNMSKDVNPIYNYKKVIVPLVQIALKEIA